MASEKADVYAFGIVLWEILTGEIPHANMSGHEIYDGVKNGKLRPSVPDSCDPEWKSLMEKCWASDPESRPSFSEIAKRLTEMNEKPQVPTDLEQVPVNSLQQAPLLDPEGPPKPGHAASFESSLFANTVSFIAECHPDLLDQINEKIKMHGSSEPSFLSRLADGRRSLQVSARKEYPQHPVARDKEIIERKQSFPSKFEDHVFPVHPTQV